MSLQTKSPSPTTRAKSGASAQAVADRAGVSVMTVSRALRGAPDVAATTRDRVLAAAAEVGYQPNTAARSLRTGKIQTVGFITWSHDALRGSYHSETLAGFDNVMNQEGHSVLISIPLHERGIADQANQIISTGQVGGVVIHASFLTEDQMATLRDLRAPSVLINHPRTDLGMSSVVYDNEQGVEQAVRHLVTLGHRRIAYIGGTPEDQDAKGREAGFLLAMQRLGMEINEEWIRPGHFAHAVESGSNQADHLLAENGEGPTAIVCASDNIAIGVIESVRRSGRSVPDTISVVGFDNSEFSPHILPSLTTVDHSGWDLGNRAAEELMRQINNPKSEPQRIVLPTRLVIRNSTARPRKS